MRSSPVILLVSAAACADPAPVYIGCEQSDRSGDDVSFDPLDMVCVDVSMDEVDYASLSEQYRFPGEEEDQWPGIIAHTARSCSEPYPDPYSYFSADVVVDGREAGDVGIRRKGFIGSVVGAGDRPSLKIKTDAFVDGQELGDTERVTLNNNHQDWTRARTCLAYSVFADAGYPAPRCNLASVSVNGEPLGTYAHVENVKKRFLRREFGNDEGSLYEGTMADFTDAHLAGLPDSLGRFEAKTGETDPSGAGLRRVADALQVPDDELEQALSEVIDLDAFLLFWALETVINHNDGYNANTNNFYIYFDPDDGDRGVFVPWGADQAFYDWQQTKVTSELARRISRVPKLRRRYLDEVEWVVDEVWDEDLLQERIDGFADQVATAEAATPDQDAAFDSLRGWVDDRRDTIDTLIADGGEVGEAEMGTCTGSSDPADFLLAAELASVVSSTCSAVPARSAGVLLPLLLLVARRRESDPQRTGGEAPQSPAPSNR
jgi:spore coat protein H